MKELERLAAIVFVISEESAICPRGSLYKLTDGYIVPNQMFRGLNERQCDNLSYYQIQRLPRNDHRINMYSQHDYSYPTDFMDSSSSVIPKGQAFSLNLQRSERVVIIKSLIWLGMTFFHKINSSKYGFIYIGDGRKNYDFLLMA